MIDIYEEIERLIEYALYKGLIEEEDRIYIRNRLLEKLNLEDYEVPERSKVKESLYSIQPILDNIMAWAIEKGQLEDSITLKDIYDTELVDVLMPRPSMVIKKFYDLYAEEKEKSTDYFYELSRVSNYIRVERVAKDIKWKKATEYGDIDITINLSKPEKDPKAIAKAKNMKSGSYPKCLLCKENEGYKGRINHPARANHRIIPVELKDRRWWLQYSPYVYYNEHCILFNDEHIPMKINKETFENLIEFIDKFPHYFIGSNADLPIVGGSILSHDHFQGGKYEFAMSKAKTYDSFVLPRFKEVTIAKVKWPMTVFRLSSKSKDEIVEAGDYILNHWRNYTDEAAGIISYSGEVPHNTITPIARFRNGNYELDLVLRNNRTSEEYPLGIFHPHEELHHIKKENIGLIEVMGLAVLPARLKEELNLIKQCLLNKANVSVVENNEFIAKHSLWYEEILHKYEDINNVDDILQEEIGEKFLQVLKHCGVFPDNEEGEQAYDRFIAYLINTKIS